MSTKTDFEGDDWQDEYISLHEMGIDRIKN
jgi:hypothetical protein